MRPNADEETIKGFGSEWSRFDQTGMSEFERQVYFNAYFSLIDWKQLPQDSIAVDIGCGSGRWAALVAERVGHLHCVDASSEALAVAARNLGNVGNCSFHLASVGDLPFGESVMDFAYSLGVLHHVPDTPEAIRKVVLTLKPGAPILLYLYYRLENRPVWFQYVWLASDQCRKVVSHMPSPLRVITAEVIACSIYWPLARIARLAERLGFNVASMPLSAYRNSTLYTMRTDALDRFGTQLERRFDQAEIKKMMEAAGLERVSFRDGIPYWCAIGFKR
jgi:ubiquinone/menaquinone biosynthesis C-methylase UbiE